MKHKTFYSPFFLLISILLFSFSISCYTSFNHPVVYLEADSTGFCQPVEVTLIDDCSGCHNQEDIYAESYSNLYNDPVYDESYDWNYYFVTPWWVEESYYYEEQAPENNEELRPQRRGFDRGGADQAPRYGTPSPSRPTLAKPASDTPTYSKPKPPKRNQRRQSVVRDNNKSDKRTPPPKRESK